MPIGLPQGTPLLPELGAIAPFSGQVPARMDGSSFRKVLSRIAISEQKRRTLFNHAANEMMGRCHAEAPCPPT